MIQLSFASGTKAPCLTCDLCGAVLESAATFIVDEAEGPGARVAVVCDGGCTACAILLITKAGGDPAAYPLAALVEGIQQRLRKGREIDVGARKNPLARSRHPNPLKTSRDTIEDRIGEITKDIGMCGPKERIALATELADLSRALVGLPDRKWSDDPDDSQEASRVASRRPMRENQG